MQNPQLPIKEIIYEITGKCYNGCSYCGSKEAWKNEIDEIKIKAIIDNICTYPPEAIDISGGDPLLVSLETHKYLINKLAWSGTKSIKIIVNPKSFAGIDNEEKIHKVLLYNWIGLSVNTKEELDIAKNLVDNLKNRVSIITNFNIGNCFLFDEIKALVNDKKCLWQVQYTIYNEENDMALYGENEAAKKFFFDKINTSLDEGVEIILADNMTKGECSAGKYSLGVLSDGTVVPCLSMRSWNKNISSISQGNLLIRSLYDIWHREFVNYRFETFKCCKDHCNNAEFCREIKTPTTLTINTTPLWGKDNTVVPVYSVYTPDKDFKNTRTVLYGVVDDNSYVYATPSRQTWTKQTGDTPADMFKGFVCIYGSPSRITETDLNMKFSGLTSTQLVYGTTDRTTGIETTKKDEI
jgi:MoaA/NifB/PqqE/SkfB family radical SAM enzyme